MSEDNEDDNVKPLFKVIHNNGTPDQNQANTIRLLEIMLAEARRGEIQEMVVIAMHAPPSAPTSAMLNVRFIASGPLSAIALCEMGKMHFAVPMITGQL